MAARSGGRAWPTTRSWSGPTISRAFRRSRRRSITSCGRRWRSWIMKHVELYGTSSCPYTRDMREWLELRGADFVEYDVETDRLARERMRRVAGAARTVPVLVE